MIRSLIISRARKMANDIDTTNPLFSDNDIHGMIDAWEMDLALYLQYPRKQQVIAFAVGDGPGTTAKALDTDILQIVKAFFEPTAGNFYRVYPKRESQMQADNPSWRVGSAADPTHYVLLDAQTVSAASFPTKNITLSHPCIQAGNLRLYATQMPAAATDGTKSPISPPPFHESAIYWCAHQMYLPRNEERALFYLKLYEDRRRKAKSLWPEYSDDGADCWDVQESWGSIGGIGGVSGSY